MSWEPIPDLKTNFTDQLINSQLDEQPARRNDEKPNQPSSNQTSFSSPRDRPSTHVNNNVQSMCQFIPLTSTPLQSQPATKLWDPFNTTNATTGGSAFVSNPFFEQERLMQISGAALKSNSNDKEVENPVDQTKSSIPFLGNDPLEQVQPEPYSKNQSEKPGKRNFSNASDSSDQTITNNNTITSQSLIPGLDGTHDDCNSIIKEKQLNEEDSVNDLIPATPVVEQESVSNDVSTVKKTEDEEVKSNIDSEPSSDTIETDSKGASLRSELESLSKHDPQSEPESYLKSEPFLPFEDSFDTSAMKNLDIKDVKPKTDFCVRNGCKNTAIECPEWDQEYCSNECAVQHCKDVFNDWVSSRQNQN